MYYFLLRSIPSYDDCKHIYSLRNSISQLVFVSTQDSEHCPNASEKPQILGLTASPLGQRNLNMNTSSQEVGGSVSKPECSDRVLSSRSITVSVLMLRHCQL